MYFHSTMNMCPTVFLSVIQGIFVGPTVLYLHRLKVKKHDRDSNVKKSKISVYTKDIIL